MNEEGNETKAHSRQIDRLVDIETGQKAIHTAVMRSSGSKARA